jgi:hypothetical protein
MSAFDYLLYNNEEVGLEENARKASVCSCIFTRIRDKINLLNKRLKTRKLEFGM